MFTYCTTLRATRVRSLHHSVMLLSPQLTSRFAFPEAHVAHVVHVHDAKYDECDSLWGEDEDIQPFLLHDESVISGSHPDTVDRLDRCCKGQYDEDQGRQSHRRDLLSKRRSGGDENVEDEEEIQGGYSEEEGSRGDPEVLPSLGGRVGGGRADVINLLDGSNDTDGGDAR